eukprot:356310-Chlamydomonas_euryale.AAC.2
MRKCARVHLPSPTTKKRCAPGGHRRGQDAKPGGCGASHAAPRRLLLPAGARVPRRRARAAAAHVRACAPRRAAAVARRRQHVGAAGLRHMRHGDVVALRLAAAQLRGQGAVRGCAAWSERLGARETVAGPT